MRLGTIVGRPTDRSKMSQFRRLSTVSLQNGRLCRLACVWVAACDPPHLPGSRAPLHYRCSTERSAIYYSPATLRPLPSLPSRHPRPSVEK
eukprot:5756228-Prymnesium_polylepis.1